MAARTALGLLHAAALCCARARGTYGPRVGRPAPRMLAEAASASAAPDLRARFVGALRHEACVGQGATVVALVSGGLDSVALLHLLAHARPALELDLHVLHFNHHTRAECDGEEAFVRGLAERHGAPFHVRHLAELPASGLQAQTRSWRRAEAAVLLAELAAARPRAGAHGDASAAAADDARDGAIALGHHADDDVETILLKWLRGCHLTRLAGMRARAGPFARPLLRFGKAELEAWLRGEGLEWREDASNARPDYRRNQVRLQLVPLLQQLTGGALGSRLADLTAQATEARALLDWARAEAAGAPAPAGAGAAAAPALAAAAPGTLDVRALLAMPAAVQTDVLHGFIAERTGRPSAYAEVQRVLARLRADAAGGPRSASPAAPFQTGGARASAVAAAARQPAAQFELHLAGRWALRRRGARLSVCALGDADGAAERWATTTLVRSSAAGDAGGAERERDAISVTHLAEHEVELAVADADDLARADEQRADAIVLYNLPPGSRLRVRARADGDRLTPAWRERPIKLKDFLRGQKVPLHARDDLSVVVREPPTRAQAGEVLAVYPSHVGRECARDDRRYPPVRLRIRARRAPESDAFEADDEDEGASQ